MASVDELEKKLEELQKIKIFNHEVESGVQHILSHLPPPEETKNMDEKVRILTLRCKARLLLPSKSQEAEDDINTILKLNKGSADTWVELAEFLFRRSACKEAIDALENTLRLDAKHVPALCLYSQVQRNRCASENCSVEEKKCLMEEAVEKAKRAIQINVDCAEAWNTLALSLLSKATMDGASREDLRKVYSAMQQAEQKNPLDPDVHFNKGMLESLLGHFSDAAKEFAKAYEQDPYRLKGIMASFTENVNILRRVNTSIEKTKGISKREFKKLCKELGAFCRKNGDAHGHVSNYSVINILSEPLMQPVTLLVVDPRNKFSLLMIYQVQCGAFKIGDIISAPHFSITTEDLEEAVDPVQALGLEEPLRVSLPHIYSSTKNLMINGRPLGESYKASLQVSSRVFA